MKPETFISAMGILQSLFGSLKDESYKLYMQRFKDFDDELFKNAVSKIQDTFVSTSMCPFPLPKHFLDAIGLSDDKCAVLAVSAVKKAGSSVGPYKSVSFGDRALHATINHFGGWIEVSNWHDTEWKFNEKKFIECYEVNRSVGNGPDYLPGRCEDSYAEKAMLMPEERRIVFLKKLQPLEVKWNGYQRIEIAPSKDIKQIEGEVSGINEIIKALDVHGNLAEEEGRSE